MLSPIIPKTPTAFEGRLIIALVSTACIAVGLFAMIFALGAPPEKQEMARELLVRGGGLTAFGVAILLVRWLILRWRDYD